MREVTSKSGSLNRVDKGKERDNSMKSTVIEAVLQIVALFLGFSTMRLVYQGLIYVMYTTFGLTGVLWVLLSGVCSYYAGKQVFSLYWLIRDEVKRI